MKELARFEGLDAFQWSRGGATWKAGWPMDCEVVFRESLYIGMSNT